MDRFTLSAALLSAAVLISSAAQATDISDYFKMADQDQNEFNAQLVVGAEKVLRDEGRADLATQLDKLFTEIKPGNRISDGFADYQANIAAMEIAEVKRQARNPNLPHLQVEKAFRATAEDHGIPLPVAFDPVASNFHPKLPLKP